MYENFKLKYEDDEVSDVARDGVSKTLFGSRNAKSRKIRAGLVIMSDKSAFHFRSQALHLVVKFYLFED